MAKKITINIKGVTYNIDEFFKSIMFQRIMDDESIDRDERDILLFIFRKTLHFNKWRDRLGIYFISKSVGIGQVKTRKVIKQLEEKLFIEVNRSNGGRVLGDTKFHEFMLHESLIVNLFTAWKSIKEEQRYDILEDEEDDLF